MDGSKDVFVRFDKEYREQQPERYACSACLRWQRPLQRIEHLQLAA